MGPNLLFRNVHTGLRQEEEPRLIVPIVQVQLADFCLLNFTSAT